MQTPPLRLLRQDSEQGRWLLATRPPIAPLRPFVLEYQGYREQGGPRLRRREMPTNKVVLILDFGPGFRLLDPADPSRGQWYGSFVAGLHRSFALVESSGSAHCLQVNLTPLGARRFLGRPLHELADRVVGLGEVLAPGAAEALVGRLLEAPDWPARFALLDRAILRRLAESEPASPLAEGALRLLTASRGRLTVEALTQRLGCSRQRLAERFREEVGLPPKALARVLRVERALQLLQRAELPRAEIALACGYYDQAHFGRDFRAATGGSPGEFLRRWRGEGAGVIAD